MLREPVGILLPKAATTPLPYEPSRRAPQYQQRGRARRKRRSAARAISTRVVFRFLGLPAGRCRKTTRTRALAGEYKAGRSPSLVVHRTKKEELQQASPNATRETRRGAMAICPNGFARWYTKVFDGLIRLWLRFFMYNYPPWRQPPHS